MRNSFFWWIVVGFMLLIDFYFFQGIKVAAHSASARTRTIIYVCYWTISLAALSFLIILPYLHFDRHTRIFRATIFAIIAGLFFAKLVASVFLLVDDIRRGIQWISGKLFFSNTEGEALEGEGISRSVFLTWAGMIIGGGLFGSLLWGFTNKYRYRVRRVKLSFPNLPAAFRGIRIVQISDIHSGSFSDKQAVMRGVQKIIDEKADLVLFTGDLVNDRADEMEEYEDVFNKITAPMGVYSTLGNHDYGDYVHWKTPEEKAANLERLKQVHARMGWRLLMNEHVVLERNKGTAAGTQPGPTADQLALIGVENWSAMKRFPKYGDLHKAYQGAAAYPFKILMSHDPSHWKAEVCKSYPDIDLMLSGHTHGMQFGVEIPGFKWSPVQYVYKEWAGLYERAVSEGAPGAGQKLYVNRGYGFIGYPGRVGILPEITVLELA